MLQHTKLLNTAQNLDITVTDVSQLMKRDAAILTYKKDTELIIDGVPMSWINVSSQFYCDNKQLTKLAYEALNIRYPKSIIFSKFDENHLQTFLKNGQVYICKPLDGTNGIGVELGIENLQMVADYYEKYQHLNTRFLLEEYVKGDDLRIQVIGGKIIAACIRKPAFVIGNGQDSLERLIAKRQAVMTKQNPNNILAIDKSTEALLAAQQVSIGDIPENNRTIQLKYVSNIAQGGVPIDVSDEIHPLYHQWAEDLATYLGTGYMGLDFITPNHKENPINQSAILEINARADWVHHTFSERRTHNITYIILKQLFPNISI